MAGSETGGMASARPDLFYGATWALVPTPATGEDAREVAEAIVEGVGGRPMWTDAELHDRTAAVTSHLPYLLSCVLADQLAEGSATGPVPELLGPGAKDMLRLAGSDPAIMAGILATNWSAIGAEAEAFARRLEALVTELDDLWRGGTDDEESIETIARQLEERVEARRHLLERHAASASEEEETEEETP